MQKFLQNENFYKILVYLISNPPDNTIPSLKANHSMLCFKINYSPVAQSVERAAVNRYVVGSSPTGGADSYARSSGRLTAVLRAFFDARLLPSRGFLPRRA